MSSAAGKWIFTSVLVVLGAAWVVGVIWFVGAMAIPSGTESASAAPSRTASLTIQTFPQTPTQAWMQEHHYSIDTSSIPGFDLHEDWVRYGPTTNFVVPAHALVTVTIENYDGQTPLLNNFYAQVQGTIGGVETVDGKPMASVDPTTVSHTFTIHSIPSSQQPWLYVSVPVVGEPDAVESAGTDNGLPPKPIVMRFSFRTGAPGVYIWQCFDPCGSNYDGFGGPMQTRGYMNGTFTVQG